MTWSVRISDSKGDLPPNGWRLGKSEKQAEKAETFSYL